MSNAFLKTAITTSSNISMDSKHCVGYAAETEVWSGYAAVSNLRVSTSLNMACDLCHYIYDGITRQLKSGIICSYTWTNKFPPRETIGGTTNSTTRSLRCSPVLYLSSEIRGKKLLMLCGEHHSHSGNTQRKFGLILVSTFASWDATAG